MRNFINKNLKTIIFIYLTWGAYFIYIWPKMLYIDNNNLIAGYRNVWGDWAMHISQVSNFKYQGIINTINNHPIYSGHKLTYPFITNLISGLLYKMGLNLVDSMIIPSIFFSLLLIFFIYLLGKQLTNNNAKSFLGLSIFFTSGGLGFIYFFQGLNSKNLLKNLIYPPQEFTHIKDFGYWWTTTLTAHLIPQRAFLLGITITIPILIYLLKIYKRKYIDIKINHIILIGILSGFLAYIHDHSLLVLFFINLWIIIVEIIRWTLNKRPNHNQLKIHIDKLIRFYLIYAIVTFITIIPFFTYLKGPDLSSFFELYPGWLAIKELHLNWIYFWIINWGLFLPIFIINFTKMIKSGKNIETTIFISGFLFLFIIANLFRFQPSTWDNHKLLLYTYLIFSFVVADILIDLWNITKYKNIIINIFIKLFTILIIIIIIFSGTLDLIRLSKTEYHHYIMLTSEEINDAKIIRNFSDPTDIFLTSTDHLNFIPMAVGRGIVLGYGGWLWSHGYNYNDRYNHIHNIYQGQKNALQLIKQYNIKYIVTDQNTNREFGNNNEFFIKNFQLKINKPEYKIWKVE